MPGAGYPCGAYAAGGGGRQGDGGLLPEDQRGVAVLRDEPNVGGSYCRSTSCTMSWVFDADVRRVLPATCTIV